MSIISFPRPLGTFIGRELKAKAMHVAGLGLQVASDVEVWRHASINDLILISKDEDFANLLLQTPTAKLIWVRVGNCRKAFLLDLFSANMASNR